MAQPQSAISPQQAAAEILAAAYTHIQQNIFRSPGLVFAIPTLRQAVALYRLGDFLAVGVQVAAADRFFAYADQPGAGQPGGAAPNG